MPRSAEQLSMMRTASGEALHTAAVKLFARRGFAGTNIRDIAREAGVSTGMVYRHYDSKEALFEELLGQAVAGLQTASQRFSEEADPHVLVLDLTRRLLAESSEEEGASDFLMVINQSFVSDQPAGARARLTEAHTLFRRAFTDVVRRGQRSGGFASGNVQQLTTCYLATLQGLITMRVAFDGDVETPSADLVARILTGGHEDD